ncbi:hypothetical protein BACPEC_01157 [[Bacteroides] pectinophilus ATCC 43243]|uniref:Uncharacterized protein n=1 Tax=[Bacteroides] pectinophilus ATCC 43243 TaxID=483218 RepID=B7AR47_9FIRM|nr:hypothetical protein BACPEC_01157 [[Bacteroides] pectinophilus ATCC 43243]
MIVTTAYIKRKILMVGNAAVMHSLKVYLKKYFMEIPVSLKSAAMVLNLKKRSKASCKCQGAFLIQKIPQIPKLHRCNNNLDIKQSKRAAFYMPKNRSKHEKTKKAAWPETPKTMDLTGRHP